jgi:hypothetical protein
MREVIEKNLSVSIDRLVVAALLKSYEAVVGEYRKGDLDGCLNNAGKFVEHTLRAIEHVRTGQAPAEIRSPASVVQEIGKDKSLPETLRVLVPRIAYAMVYEVRSKRGAVHVKEIDPRQIDASLCVQSASWIVAELLRLFHIDSEASVTEAMATLMRAEIPLVEVFDGEVAVTAKVTCELEMLLLIARSAPHGTDRRSLGGWSKFSPVKVTRAIQKLEVECLIHKTRDGLFHITGPGERYLTNELAKQGLWIVPAAA